MTPAEWKRKALHAGMGLFALALRYLDWKTAALCAGAALAFNVFAKLKSQTHHCSDYTKQTDSICSLFPTFCLHILLSRQILL